MPSSKRPPGDTATVPPPETVTETIRRKGSPGLPPSSVLLSVVVSVPSGSAARHRAASAQSSAGGADPANLQLHAVLCLVVHPPRAITRALVVGTVYRGQKPFLMVPALLTDAMLTVCVERACYCGINHSNWGVWLRGADASEGQVTCHVALESAACRIPEWLVAASAVALHTARLLQQRRARHVVPKCSAVSTLIGAD